MTARRLCVLVTVVIVLTAGCTGSDPAVSPTQSDATEAPASTDSPPTPTPTPTETETPTPTPTPTQTETDDGGYY